MTQILLADLARNNLRPTVTLVFFLLYISELYSTPPSLEGCQSGKSCILKLKLDLISEHYLDLAEGYKFNSSLPHYEILVSYSRDSRFIISTIQLLVPTPQKSLFPIR